MPPSVRPVLLFMGMTAFMTAAWFMLPSATESEWKSGNPAEPRLAVLIYFDQFRGDYLARWEELYEEDGFKRLMKDGAWYADCHYPYANTQTSPGHASVASGCWPARHGVVGNEFYDRTTESSVSAVTSERYHRIPPRTDGRTGGTPERMLSPTVADVLKTATRGKGKVVSLSHKDRSAILPGGKRPDACYWFDEQTGGFATSSYYRDAPHPWVARFNKSKPSDGGFGKQWNYLRPSLDYTKHSGPDDVEAESTGYKQGRVFPHPMDGGLDAPGENYYKALLCSPMGNQVLLEFAKLAVVEEKLGQDHVPDLLSLSFSCNDLVGHAWGPDSHEVLDCALRTDLIVRDLLAFLDEKVGKGKYYLVMTADHGVCPLPEVSRANGVTAKRLPSDFMTSDADDFLAETFGKPEGGGRWVEETAGHWIYLNQAMIRRRRLNSAQVEEALAAWLKKQEGVQAVYTRSQLAKGLPAEDTLGEMVRKSFYPHRLGDVCVITEPYYLVTRNLTGTSHGSPHSYDTHVPLMVFGPGVKAGVRKERVSPLAAAAILADALGIDPPRDAETKTPARLFED